MPTETSEFFVDPDAIDLPWCESPFFFSILTEKLSTLTGEEYWDKKSNAIAYNRDGYLVIDLGLTKDFIEELKRDILEHIDESKKQQGHFHYSDNPRIFEAWKWSKNTHQICKHPKLLSTLEFLYGRKPRPFQTINFIYGSNQPKHQDAIHFYTVPERWMVGVWVALEEMDLENGTLSFCPGSHKLPFYDFQNLNLNKCAYGEEEENYRRYEEFIDALIEAERLPTKHFIAKPGEAIIWAANLLHGGSPIKDRTRTRWSQAIHYYFGGCDKYYCPLFSNRREGEYSLKNIAEKDILNHEPVFV